MSVEINYNLEPQLTKPLDNRLGPVATFAQLPSSGMLYGTMRRYVNDVQRWAQGEYVGNVFTWTLDPTQTTMTQSITTNVTAAVSAILPGWTDVEALFLATGSVLGETALTQSPNKDAYIQKFTGASVSTENRYVDLRGASLIDMTTSEIYNHLFMVPNGDDATVAANWIMIDRGILPGNTYAQTSVLHKYKKNSISSNTSVVGTYVAHSATISNIGFGDESMGIKISEDGLAFYPTIDGYYEVEISPIIQSKEFLITNPKSWILQMVHSDIAPTLLDLLPTATYREEDSWEGHETVERSSAPPAWEIFGSTDKFSGESKKVSWVGYLPANKYISTILISAGGVAGATDRYWGGHVKVTRLKGSFILPENVLSEEYLQRSGDLSFTFTQSAPSSEWVIVHNLNKFPSVSTVDSSSEQVQGTVEYTDLNSLTITFSSSFSGQAFLN